MPACAVDDRPHGLVRLRTRRRPDDREHEIEFRRGQHEVERDLHGVVACAGYGEVDEAGRPDLDACGGKPRPRRGARRLDGDAAAGERVDHHGGTARRRGHHADLLAPAARERHAGKERQPFEQAVERVDPRDAAGGEKDICDIIIAGERAGMCDGKLARRGGAAELVGNDRLAAVRCRGCEAVQRIGMPHRLQKQQVAVDAGIVERGLAYFAQRKIDLVADRDQPGETDIPRLAARKQRSDQTAGVRGGKDAADRQVDLVEGGIRRQHHLVAQIDDAEARRPDDTDAGSCAGIAQAHLACAAVHPGLGKAVGEHGRDLDAEPRAGLDRFHGGIGRRNDVNMLGCLGQRLERGPRALAQHGLAPRVDGIDAPAITHLPQEFQRPPGGLAGIVRLPDNGDRAG